eukprot:4905717-Amphidinium_carterae.2
MDRRHPRAGWEDQSGPTHNSGGEQQAQSHQVEMNTDSVLHTMSTVEYSHSEDWSKQQSKQQSASAAASATNATQACPRHTSHTSARSSS